MPSDIPRNPITREDVEGTEFRGGVKRPRVDVGAMNTEREMAARAARRHEGENSTMLAGVDWGGGRERSAGMMMQTQPLGAGLDYTGYLDAYKTSYAQGLSGALSGATYDIPTYFVLMNEQNGGVIYWPTTLKEKFQWYRYFVRTDSYVGRAMELLTDLPMSKVTLNMPEIGDKEKQAEILEFFEYQVQRLGLFGVLQSSLWEMNMIGAAYMFHEWDDEMKMWSDVTFLPPEEVGIFQYPFSQKTRVEYRPARLLSLIDEYGKDSRSFAPQDDMTKEIVDNIPDDIYDMVQENGAIIMDTDPMTGSFVYVMSRRRSPYLDMGPSILERVLVPMLQKENYRYTQLSLASRNMTPKNVITAPTLTREELDDLRMQVDLSYMDPEYSIVANYDIQWDQIGADQRLLDLSREYETIDSQVFAAMGVTRELLTGEGSYSGTKVTIEILNTMFLQARMLLSEYVEQELFIPVCEAHGWYNETKHGFKNYWYPRLGFNRLTIRDNAEVFDSLFQLYQKGSLPVDVIYELFNLDADTLHQEIKDDLFTVKDSNFNRVVEDVASEIGRALPEQTNIIERVADYLGLKYTAGEEGGSDFGGFDDFGDFGGSADDGGQDFGFDSEDEALGGDGADEGTDEGVDVEDVAQAVADGLPEGATDEDIQSVVDEI